jgi:hypothetical protein
VDVVSRAQQIEQTKGPLQSTRMTARQPIALINLNLSVRDENLLPGDRLEIWVAIHISPVETRRYYLRHWAGYDLRHVVL